MSEQLETHILANYKVIKKIGSGAYGHVYQVIDRKSKKMKALKKNFDAFNNSTDAQRTYREIMFLMELKHPNIIVLEETIQAENGKDIYLVFEHMDADLHRLIRENLLAEKHKKYILYQTAKAILYLHTAGLIHRDLKPSNILVNQSCDAKLCDFGLVRSIDDQNDDNNDILTEYIATRWYRAPQILLGSRAYSKGIDIWSFGCMVAQMVKGKPLFPGTSTINQLERVLMWTGPPSQSDIESLKTQFGKELLETVLKTKKANKRQFFNEIDPECLDLICKCLLFNPDQRIGIEEIIKHPYLSEFYEKNEIIKCSKKVKIAVDDNRRLSLKDYRGLIYEQIRKRNKNSQYFNVELKDVHESNLYRIRERPKKSIRTQQSDQVIKETCKIYPAKKSSVTYENQSKTVSIKKNQNSKKKSFYKAESLYSKNLKTLDQEDVKQKANHEREKIKRDELSQIRKATLFKQSNRCTKTQWSKVKRSVTQGDGKKDKKLVTNFVDLGYFYKK